MGREHSNHVVVGALLPRSTGYDDMLLLILSPFHIFE